MNKSINITPKKTQPSHIKIYENKQMQRVLISIIGQKLNDGLGRSSIKEWQSFWQLPLKEFSQFDNQDLHGDTRLEEVVSLFCTTYTMNHSFNKDRFDVALQGEKTDQGLHKITGKSSWDGFIFDKDLKGVSPVEQKGYKVDPHGSIEGSLNDQVKDFLKDLKSRDKLKDENCFWILNVAPYIPEGEARNLDFAKVANELYKHTDSKFSGSICFYTLPTNQTLEIICFFCPSKDSLSHIDLKNAPQFIRRIKFTSKFVPKLRFREFSGAWEEKKLGDIADFSKGTNISKEDIVEGGITEAIRYGELYTTYGEVIDEIQSRTNLPANKLVLSKKNDVIIPASGETHIDIATASCVLKNDVALSGDINIIRTENNGIFMAYYLNGIKKHDIARLGQGVSVVHLYSSNLKKLVLNLPHEEEQKKIAGFLSAVDDKISGLEKKKELLEKYKKGVMQKIFAQQIRFKGFSDKWKETSLGEVAKIVKGQQLNGDQLRADGKYPMLNGGIAPSGFTDKYNTPEKTVTISEGGNSCGYVSFMKDKFWSGGHLYALEDLNINKYFLYHQLKKFQAKIMRLRVGSGLPNIQKKDLIKLDILLPPKEEQEKIADFLTAIDDKIELENKKLQQAKKFKKALLQEMFV